MGRFPRFNGNMRCSDVLTILLPHFVSFAWQYHSDAHVAVFHADRPRRQPAVRIVSIPALPSGHSWKWNGQDLLGSWETPSCTCPVL